VSNAALAILLAVAGTAAGGFITWLLAAIYFRKQDRRAEQIFEAQAHFLESLAGVVTKTGKISITFTRDAKGRNYGCDGDPQCDSKGRGGSVRLRDRRSHKDTRDPKHSLSSYSHRWVG
jgi:hypothetical protein